jgi:hypothetical protein
MPPKKKSSKKEKVPKRTAVLGELEYAKIVQGTNGPKKSSKLSLGGILNQLKRDRSFVYDTVNKVAGPEKLVKEYVEKIMESSYRRSETFNSGNSDKAMNLVESKRSNKLRNKRDVKQRINTNFTALEQIYNFYQAYKTERGNSNKGFSTYKSFSQRMEDLPKDMVLNITKLHLSNKGRPVGAVKMAKPGSKASKSTRTSRFKPVPDHPKAYYDPTSERDEAKNILGSREVLELFRKFIDWKPEAVNRSRTQSPSPLRSLLRSRTQSSSSSPRSPLPRSHPPTPPRSRTKSSSPPPRSLPPPPHHPPTPPRSHPPTPPRARTPLSPTGARSPAGDDDVAKLFEGFD